MMSSVLELWKNDLKTINEKAAEALADPTKYPNLFPDLEWALKVESIFKSARHTTVPASSYPTAKVIQPYTHLFFFFSLFLSFSCQDID